MKTKWRKLGLIYCPSGIRSHPKLLSHAANPLPVLIEGNLYRIFFSGRDINNRSSIGAVDIDIIEGKVIQEHAFPFFEHGPAGSYYADGVSIGNCYEVNGINYMLFMGWQTPKDGQWRGDIGRLVLKADLTLELESEDPYMKSDAIDPVSLSYPWVIREESGLYRMWYGSTITWDAGNGEMLHVLKLATSEDGSQWQKHGLAVPYQSGIAQAFSRPSVIGNLAQGYQMWFSYRSGLGQKYRIGFATSAMGDEWIMRLGDAGIDVSDEGWDSEMIEYPFVFDHEGERYMLYNGNNYGKTGFGLAVMDQAGHV